MSTIITPDMVVGEALDYFHTQARFIGSINRQYDDQFAKPGQKIGSSLRIKMPNEHVVGDGAVIVPQPTEEVSQVLTLAKRKHVALDFSDEELTMSINDFKGQHIEPAMKRLIAHVEADAASMCLDVANSVGTPGTAMTSATESLTLLANVRKKINDNSFISNDNRNMLINTGANVTFIGTLSGVYNPAGAIGQQYTKGLLASVGGFDIREHSLLPTPTCGSRTNTTPLTNGVDQEGSSLAIDGLNTATATIKAGDTFTISGVYEVHPETKTETNVLRQFVVTADATGSGSAVTLSISPAIISTGARKNCSAVAADGATITFLGTASTAYPVNIAYDKDAFTFVTADLEMPKNMDMASRGMVDGISMRFIRGYDVITSRFISRLDILYGYKTIRPELASRVYC